MTQSIYVYVRFFARFNEKYGWHGILKTIAACQCVSEWKHGNVGKKDDTDDETAHEKNTHTRMTGKMSGGKR